MEDFQYCVAAAPFYPKDFKEKHKFFSCLACGNLIAEEDLDFHRRAHSIKYEKNQDKLLKELEDMYHTEGNILKDLQDLENKKKELEKRKELIENLIEEKEQEIKNQSHLPIYAKCGVKMFEEITY